MIHWYTKQTRMFLFAAWKARSMLPFGFWITVGLPREGIFFEFHCGCTEQQTFPIVFVITKSRLGFTHNSALGPLQFLFVSSLLALFLVNDRSMVPLSPRIFTVCCKYYKRFAEFFFSFLLKAAQSIASYQPSGCFSPGVCLYSLLW